MFIRDPGASAREKDLIKYTPDGDLFMHLISDAKMSTPGLKKFMSEDKKRKYAAKNKKKG